MYNKLSLNPGSLFILNFVAPEGLHPVLGELLDVLQEAKPLFVRFGTETGGQIRVKGARKVLGGRMEKKRRKESNT